MGNGGAWHGAHGRRAEGSVGCRIGAFARVCSSSAQRLRREPTARIK